MKTSTQLWKEGLKLDAQKPATKSEDRRRRAKLARVDKKHEQALVREGRLPR